MQATKCALACVHAQSCVRASYACPCALARAHDGVHRGACMHSCAYVSAPEVAFACHSRCARACVDAHALSSMFLHV
eukprot:2615394-Pleurochrysis_carterae.AAC.3